MNDIGCDIITIPTDKTEVGAWLQSAQERLRTQNLLIEEKNIQKLKHILEERLERDNLTIHFAKGAINMLAPIAIKVSPNNLHKDKEFFTSTLSKLAIDRLLSIQNLDSLVNFVIDFYSDKITSRDNIRDVLSVICLTHKGLTEAEILKICNVSQEELWRILTVFRFFLVSFNGYWICSSEPFRHIIREIGFKDHEKETEYHKRIAHIFEKAPNNIRKLEEETNHLYLSEDNFALKQKISVIENFLILFNPMTKFDLFRYWRRLEQSGYDPVTEYNKGVEQFDIQYIPEPDKLFIIILQVCRFLKEFSDFETAITPVFRHPLIKGKIGVAKKKPKKEDFKGRTERSQEKGEGSSTNRLGKNTAENSKSPGKSNQPSGALPLRQQASVEKSKMQPSNSGQTARAAKKDIKSVHGNGEISKRRRKLDPMGLEKPFYNEENEIVIEENSKTVYDDNEDRTFNYLDVIGLLKELRQFNLTNDSSNSTAKEDHKNFVDDASKRRFDEILEEWEDVNVEVPAGRDRFRQRFIELINEKYKYKKREKTLEAKEQGSSTTKSNKKASVSEEVSTIERRDRESSKHFSKDNLALEDDPDKHKYQSMIDEIDLEIKPEKEPSYYYYKRWIWIIFPWACMSTSPQLNFSEVISKCYNSTTQLIKVTDESKENSVYGPTEVLKAFSGATKYMRNDDEREFYKSRKFIYFSRH